MWHGYIEYLEASGRRSLRLLACLLALILNKKDCLQETSNVII